MLLAPHAPDAQCAGAILRVCQTSAAGHVNLWASLARIEVGMKGHLRRAGARSHPWHGRQKPSSGRKALSGSQLR
jgi:hypothetical protein